MFGSKTELREFGAGLVARGLRTGAIDEQRSRFGVLPAIFGEARFGKEAFRGIHFGDVLRDGGGFLYVATGEAGSNEIVLEEIALGLEIAGVERDCGVEFSPELMGEEDQAEGTGVPGFDADDFGELAMVFRDPAVERDGFFGVSFGGGVVAERVSDLGEKVVGERIVGGHRDPGLDEDTGFLPMSGRDQLFGIRLGVRLCEARHSCKQDD